MMKAALILLALLIAGPTFAQQQPAPTFAPQSTAASSDPAIDPTKNVLDLVNAESKYQNMARDYEGKLRDVEMRRIKELSEQKEKYDAQLAMILRANQDDGSKLLATQLKELKNDLSERMSKQERFQYETSGKATGAESLWAFISAAMGLLIGGVGVAFAMNKRAA